MKSKLLQRMAKGLFVLVLLLLATTPVILAQEETPPNPYFSVETLTLPDGTPIDQVVINGPPTRPPGFEDERPAAPGAVAAAGTLPVPAYDWAYGCSATSAAMIAGYYDRAEYPNMYAGPTNGSVAPMDSSVWTTTAWNTDCPGPGSTTVRNNPLSATRAGVDGRATAGHVDDYWIGYNCPGPDPWTGSGTEHTHGDCTGDYMNTNQWVYPTGGFNTDGSTVFYYYGDGSATPTSVLLAAGVPYSYDGAVGFQQFLEARGYTVVNAYNQYRLGYASATVGFTYDQFKAEIDAGRPTLIHVEGHTMAGVGYDDTSSDLIYVNDTWDHSSGVHTMIWGGSYSGMAHVGVTVMQLAPIAYVSTQSGSWENSSTWVGGPSVPPGPNSDVTISAGDTVTLIGDSNAMTLTVESGAALDLDGYGLTVGGAVTNNGTMSQTLTVPNSTTTEFLRIQNVGGSEDKYLGVDITPSTGSMGSTTVAVRGNQECTVDDPGDTVDRCFQITPSASQTANVRFHYLDSELDAENVAAMQAYRWGGSSWAAVAGAWARNDGTPYNYCQANGMTQYGIITLASAGPTAVTAGDLATNAPQLIPVAIGLLVLILIGGGLAIRHRKRGRAS